MFADGYGKRVLSLLRWKDGLGEFPITLGRDFCGVVMDKGCSVSADFKTGDKVWGVIEPHQIGALAEFVVVDQRYVWIF